MSALVLIAGFDTPQRAAAAVTQMRRAGHSVREGYGPLSSEELSDAVGRRPSRIRIFMFFAAIVGVLGGLAMQYWSAVHDYPINSGGRPLASWPAFIPVAFELGVLLAALGGFVALLSEAQLTRLHAPVFELDISRASQDRFFLEIETAQPTDARQLLERIGADTIEELPP